MEKEEKTPNNCFKLSRFFVTLFARRSRKKCANRFAVEAPSLSQCWKDASAQHIEEYRA